MGNGKRGAGLAKWVTHKRCEVANIIGGRLQRERGGSHVLTETIQEMPAIELP
jgi:hypothetical protein